MRYNRFSLVARAMFARFALVEAPSAAALSSLSSAITSEAATARAAESANAGAASGAAADATSALSSITDLQGIAITGSGLPLKFGATTQVLGDGSEHNVGTISVPGALGVADGHKYILNGTVRVLGGATDPANAGKHLGTIGYSNVVISRVAGAWVLDTAGQSTVYGGETITGTFADYFATVATDAPQFGESASGHNLTMFYTHATATYVTLEGDFTIADQA